MKGRKGERVKRRMGEWEKLSEISVKLRGTPWLKNNSDSDDLFINKILIFINININSMQLSCNII